jgi:hypothetical protein
MLELFLSVSLYPLQQSGQSHLLLLSQPPLLLKELIFKLVLIVLPFVGLHLVSFDATHFCVFVLAHGEKDFFLTSHIHQLLGPILLSLSFVVNLLRK